MGIFVVQGLKWFLSIAQAKPKYWIWINN